MTKRDYDSTVARIAGNIASGLVRFRFTEPEIVAQAAVAMARAIVEETRRTEAPERPRLVWSIDEEYDIIASLEGVPNWGVVAHGPTVKDAIGRLGEAIALTYASEKL